MKFKTLARARSPQEQFAAVFTGRFGRNAGVLILVALLSFLTLYPTVMLLYGSLRSAPPGWPGVFNLDGYWAVLTTETLGVLLTTAEMAIATTIPSIVLAILLAWIIARTDTPFARTLEVLITLPFFIPPILTALAWSMLGNSQNGLVNQVWRSLTASNNVIVNVYSFGGIVWHLMQYTTVFMFIFIVDAFRAMDPAMEEASQMSGATQWRTFRGITLLMMTPALVAAFMLSFIRCVEAFDSPLFFGLPAGVTVVTTEIYSIINRSFAPNWQYATAMSIIVVLLMSLLVLLQWRILRGRNYQTVSGRGYQPKAIRLGPWRWLTFAFCILFFMFTVALPIGQLIVGSAFKFFGLYRWKMLTFANYVAVWENTEFWRALRNTMLLGLVGSTSTMILGCIVAYVDVRTRYRSRRVIDALTWLPLMMPGIVLGVGFVWAFAILPKPFTIYGTIWALFIGYVALGTPIAARVMSAGYAQLSFDLEECSRVNGASWWQTLWRILVALTWPSFVAGWVLIFFGILRELSVSILLYSAGSEVLSVVLLKLWTNGEMEQVSVMGLFLMLLVILFRFIHLRLVMRRISTL